MFELFDMPRGQCFGWTWDVLISYLLGNGLTVFAYVAIPVEAFLFRRGLQRPPRLFELAAVLSLAFVLSCGIGHAIAMAIVWVPLYRIEAYWSVVTGVVSVTAWLVLRTLRPVAAKAINFYHEQEGD